MADDSGNHPLLSDEDLLKLVDSQDKNLLMEIDSFLIYISRERSSGDPLSLEKLKEQIQSRTDKIADYIKKWEP
jgi:hypothetical protein